MPLSGQGGTRGSPVYSHCLPHFSLSWAPVLPHQLHASPSLLTVLSHFVFLYRLSGAVIKGYEQDVGTRTSFYGFTAFSLTQSLLILGSRGFRHVPVGEVSREKELAWPQTLDRGHVGEGR